MEILRTRFYSEEAIVPSAVDLLVTDVTNLDIDEWVAVVKEAPPLAVIPPYDPMDAQRTSRCADMAQTRLDNVGVVVCGSGNREREEFFLWAQENNYAPIVLLPHRDFTRQRQIMQLAVPKYIKRDTWIHLPEPIWDFDEHAWPGRYTTGEEFRRIM